MFGPCSCLFSSSASKGRSVPNRRLKFLRPGEKPKNFVTGLGDLPDCLIKDILCRLKPADVARLARVNCSFRVAAYSDCVWLKMLPSSYAKILAQASDAPASTCSKKEVYDFLCRGVLLQNCTRAIWLDRATGAVCQSIGAKELVNLGWLLHIPTIKSFRFAEVASVYLTLLPVRRTLLFEGIPCCSLSPGTYVLSWRLFLRDEWHPDILSPWPRVGPIRFSFKATGNAPVNVECYLSPSLSCRPSRVWLLRTQVDQQPDLGYRVDPDGWIELDVGKFNVESKGSQIEVKFSIATFRDLERCGLYVDCVMIRPSVVIPPEWPGYRSFVAGDYSSCFGHNLAWSYQRPRRFTLRPLLF